jgi:hypothetical protein
MDNVAALPPIKREVRIALMSIVAYKAFTTPQLIAMARSLPGGRKILIPDRLTAIVLLLGTKPLDNN